MQHVADALRSAAGNAACRPPSQRADERGFTPRPLNYVVAPDAAAGWPAGCGGGGTAAALCDALTSHAQHREVVLVAAASAAALDSFFARANSAGFAAAVVVGGRDDDATAARARELGGGAWVPAAAAAGGGGGSAAFKWAAVAEVLAAGCSAFVADAAAELYESPLPYAHRDSDVEGVATATSYMARGHVLSVDDAQMGWSRYAQSMVISPLNPSLGYFAATHQSVQLLSLIHI